MTIEKVGLFQKGKGITTSEWKDCLKNSDTAELIEANLGLKNRSFKKGRKGE
jgi:hypothetical protein